MVLTITNHHPFQLPSDAGKPPLAIDVPEERGYMRLPGMHSLVGRHTVPMLRTMNYTDEAIGDFFEGARRRPWFSETIFVVTSDHGLPIAPLSGRMTTHRLEELRHRVPLLFYAPDLIAPGTRARSRIPGRRRANSPRPAGHRPVRARVSAAICSIRQVAIRLDPS